MKRACPTIQELLAFDAVARHRSLTRAATALCVSVSAVSKQLASLEDFVGRPLLEKQGRGVRLTPQGREYLTKVSPSLRTLETATFELRAGSSGAGVIALASTPTFLTKWLIPRLADFRRLHPGVTFSFSQHLGPGEAHAAGIDAAIRFGAGQWPSVHSDYIAGRECVCVYSCALLPPTRTQLELEDLLTHTLLHHEETPLGWSNWAAHHGVDEVRFLSGPRFVQYTAIIQGVLSGLGVGLVPRILVDEEIAAGALLVFGDAVTMENGHYLCFVASQLERPLFAAFRSWVLAQTRP
ncbi:MAG: LysR family transcriptional regulator [Proteobacteria bacterium]|nr:LysR family transcriptional regulator [Pseudomonadota bacterium]